MINLIREEIENTLGLDDFMFIENIGILAINIRDKKIEVVKDCTYSYFDFYNQNNYWDIVRKISKNDDIDDLLKEIDGKF